MNATGGGPGIAISSSVPTSAEGSHDNNVRREHQGGIEETTEATEDDDDEDDDDNDDDDEEEDEDEEEEEDDEDEEDDEPRLKYARLTQHLGGVYRNADATSSFLVAGDKMIVGTHNGNIVCLKPLWPSKSVHG